MKKKTKNEKKTISIENPDRVISYKYHYRKKTVKIVFVETMELPKVKHNNTIK